jgi:putative spermidine/putrescine transport system permease protein
MTARDLATMPRPTTLRRLAGTLYRHPRLQLGALLAAPVAWLVIAYLGSLALFLITSFWHRDSFSGNVIAEPTLKNYAKIVGEEVYRTIALRTVLMATLVTITDVILAFPIALYMSKFASRRVAGALVVSILLPLWSGYLVKVYAWRLILNQGGILNWALEPLGLKGPGYGDAAVWLVESYLWLPYMIIPIYAGLERLPVSLLEASADLGGRTWTTLRRVIVPLVLPAAVAGSIFTFSLTLGDYITPTLVSNTRFLGNVVYDFIGVAGDRPFAAAYAVVPVVIMLIYLLIARRLGAFEAL